jgi:uncharacterized membrane protein
MSFNALRDNLTAILRYFASAVVGVILIWVYDNQHDVFWEALNLTRLPVLPQWVIAALLAVTGLVTYFAHRTVVHPIIGRIIFAIRGTPWQAPADVNDLHRARWERRGAPEGSQARSIQQALDEINAAVHFFYCSVWSSLLIVALMWYLVPNSLCLSGWFVVALILLLILAIRGDFRAARFDVEAFRIPPSRQFPRSTQEAP